MLRKDTLDHTLVFEEIANPHDLHTSDGQDEEALYKSPESYPSPILVSSYARARKEDDNSGRNSHFLSELIFL